MNKNDAVFEMIRREFSATPTRLIEMAYMDTKYCNSFNEITDLLDDDEREFDSYLPMWGTMWRVDSGFVYSFVCNHIKEISRLGFRIYEDYEERELYLGIDGGGYDFISEHWTPLYDLIGFRWHDESEVA